MSGAQVKSKDRVRDHGEVLTAEREVNAMLDLVKNETLRIESRFLEPACGTGNFLAPVLERKLELIKKRYSRSQLEFERYSVIALGSVYGIDIQEDNALACRTRLHELFDAVYSTLYKKCAKAEMRAVAGYVLTRNILHGDALSLKTPPPKNEPIIFSEWSLVRGSLIKRRDFAFHELLPDTAERVGLFAAGHISDSGTPAFIPTPIKEYPPRHYLMLHV